MSKEELQEEIKTFPGTFTEWLDKYSEPDCSDFDMHKDVWDEARGVSFTMRGDNIEAHIFKAKSFDLNFQLYATLEKYREQFSRYLKTDYRMAKKGQTEGHKKVITKDPTG